jgi:hypothetical protein
VGDPECHTVQRREGRWIVEGGEWPIVTAAERASLPHSRPAPSQLPVGRPKAKGGKSKSMRAAKGGNLLAVAGSVERSLRRPHDFDQFSLAPPE